MATTISSAALVPVTPVFSNTERLALASFLAGYSGLTRQAYELDLRQYAAWCQPHQLRLFQARRANVECFARDLEARRRARAAITRRLCTVAGFYRYAAEEDLLDHSPAAHVRPSAAGLRITRHRPGSQRARRAARRGRARCAMRARAHLAASPERAAGIRSRWRRYRCPGHRARAPDAGGHPQRRQGRHGTAGAAHRPGNRSGRWRAYREAPSSWLRTDGGWTGMARPGSYAASPGRLGLLRTSGPTRCGTHSSPRRWTPGSRSGTYKRPPRTLIRGRQ